MMLIQIGTEILSAFTYVLNYCAERNNKKMKKLQKKRYLLVTQR